MKVKHKREQCEGDVYVGRPSKFGNPFVIGRDGTREQVIAKYEHWIRSQPALMEQAKKELRGHDIVCWCSPLACHGDILKTICEEEN